MFQQNFNKIYTMTLPNERNIIIQNINNNILESETISGKKQDWWKKKHYPENDIPTKIYLFRLVKKIQTKKN